MIFYKNKVYIVYHLVWEEFKIPEVGLEKCSTLSAYICIMTYLKCHYSCMFLKELNIILFSPISKYYVLFFFDRIKCADWYSHYTINLNISVYHGLIFSEYLTKVTEISTVGTWKRSTMTTHWIFTVSLDGLPRRVASWKS